MLKFFSPHRSRPPSDGLRADPMDIPHTLSRRSRILRSGQAMVESVLVIIVACFCFLTVFQYANLFAAKAVLTHAAARAARARCVGFNEWMVTKSARVAAIPACGKRLVPASAGVDSAITTALSQKRVGDIWDLALVSSTQAPGIAMELARLPDYMDSQNDPTGSNILNYELWDALTVDTEESANLDGTSANTLTVNVELRHPLLVSLAPMAEGVLQSAADDETLSIAGFYTIESHYPLYMEDMHW